eukprot:TRINITY_DN736_c2_g1_i1.p1 TRINITY_DN736_c2_g1~~TRINITY_DN736_c2_g1_i1.p1  ORF type:complete len:422 (+),score=71.33 TRINITY_DN736_c2_g1_i1:95-1267(+)
MALVRRNVGRDGGNHSGRYRRTRSTQLLTPVLSNAGDRSARSIATDSEEEFDDFMPSNQKEAIAALFKRLDKNGDGLVPAEKLCRYIKEHGIMTVPDNEVAALERLCAEADGEMGLGEFEALLSTLRDEESFRELRRCLLAEFVSMFVFAFLGSMPDAGGLGNALLVVCLIYSFANVSGAHMNPAATFAIWMAGQIPLRKAVAYVVVEMVSAAAGSYALKATGIHEVSRTDFLMCPTPRPGMTAWQVFIIETVSTFTLFTLFMGAAVDPKAAWGPVVPLVIGIAIYGLITCVGPLSGACMNPARLFGASVAFGCAPTPTVIAAYVFGAFTGAGSAASVYCWAFLDRPSSNSRSSEPARFRFMSFDIGRLRRRLHRLRRSSTPSTTAEIER